jgi:hypothetical protein
METNLINLNLSYFSHITVSHFILLIIEFIYSVLFF